MPERAGKSAITLCDGLFAASESVVYTAVTSGYDVVLPPRHQEDCFTYALYSDSAIDRAGWDYMPVVQSLASPILTNRYHKFFPHLFLPGAEYSIYVDGNIGLIGKLSPLMDEFVSSGAAIGLFRHRDRSTLDEEVEACLDKGKFDNTDLAQYRQQLQYYAASGMPQSRQLTDNAVIFRWHKHPLLEPAMSEWWDQLHQFTKRDQISLPYVLWKHDVPTKLWNWSIREPNPFFEKYGHSGSSIRNGIIRLKNLRHRHRWLQKLYDLMKSGAA